MKRACAVSNCERKRGNLPAREISLFYFDYSVGKRHFPTFIKKSILKDASWRAGAGMLAHIRVHPRATRSLTHVIIQNMYFIYYITHKILKIYKNIA